MLDNQPQISSSSGTFSKLTLDRPMLGHFRVEILDIDENKLAESVFSYDCKQQTENTTVHFWLSNGQLQVLTDQFEYAGTKIRRVFPYICKELECGKVWDLPRQEDVESSQLGGEFLPSAGSAIQVNRLTAHHVEDDRAKNLPQSSAVELLQRYLSGEPQSTTAVLAILRLLDGLKIPFCPELPLAKRHERSAHLPLWTADQLKERLTTAPEERGAAFKVRCEREFVQERPFLQTMNVGHDLCFYRRGMDSVDVGGYLWNAGQLCMIIKRGLRPALVVRELLETGSYQQTGAVAYEGVAESLEGELTIAAIKKRASCGIREELGFEPTGEPYYVGSSFPIPSRHLERAFNCLVEVDPSVTVNAHYTVDERIDRFCVPVNEIIELCNQGIIKDPRLEINARLLARRARQSA